MSSGESSRSSGRLDRVIAQARREQLERGQSYRARALKIYPWVCGRCAREFTAANVSQLTVHHRDGNHDNNPPDGSNWELLCIYCHENEHAREVDNAGRAASSNRDPEAPATHKPFADLASLLSKDK